MKRELTAKQRLFADEYLKYGNATRAAINAGYSHKTARAIGTENLTKPNIKSYIDEKMKEIESNKIADADEVIKFFTAVLRGQVKEKVAVSGVDGVETVELPPNIKIRVAAGKEIIKRYPNSDEMLKAQVSKAKAEAKIKEYEANQLEDDSVENPMIKALFELVNDERTDKDETHDNQS